MRQAACFIRAAAYHISHFCSCAGRVDCMYSSSSSNPCIKAPDERLEIRYGPCTNIPLQTPDNVLLERYPAWSGELIAVACESQN
jgi:hypothetical protein